MAIGGEQADGNGEADETVGSELEQDAGEDDAAGCGRFGMRQGKPGVDGEEGHFDGEAGQEGKEDPISLLIGEGRPGVLDDGSDVEGAGVVSEIDGGGEGEDGAGEGKEEEFSGGVAALGAAPDADDEEHGNEGEFEEDVEDEDVAGDEDAEHGGQEQEHP